MGDGCLGGGGVGSSSTGDLEDVVVVECQLNFNIAEERRVIAAVLGTEQDEVIKGRLKTLSSRSSIPTLRQTGTTIGTSVVDKRFVGVVQARVTVVLTDAHLGEGVMNHIVVVTLGTSGGSTRAEHLDG